MAAEAVTISLAEGQQVSGLWLRPDGAKAALVLAHGAGVGMTHKSMAAVAEGLAKRKIATLRFNFLYMEKKSGRPDAPPLAHKAVRAAVAEGTSEAAAFARTRRDFRVPIRASLEKIYSQAGSEGLLSRTPSKRVSRLLGRPAATAWSMGRRAARPEPVL